MKIMADLVLDKVPRKPIGFTDLGDPNLNLGSLEKVDEVASHALTFPVSGVCAELTAAQLMPLFRKRLPFLRPPAICGSLQPPPMVHLQAQSLDGSEDTDVFYPHHQSICTHWFLYFFSDAPHLVKTTRNCLPHSGDLYATLMVYFRLFFTKESLPFVLLRIFIVFKRTCHLSILQTICILGKRI